MKIQWQLYKTLEQIPDSVLDPQTHPQRSARIMHLWRSIVDSMSGKDPDTLQLEHLERCWLLELASKPAATVWQSWWESVSRSLSLQEQSVMAEPKVWRSVDESGQIWWHVYSPRTGEQADLNSEDEVCIWIEQSFYR